MTRASESVNPRLTTSPSRTIRVVIVTGVRLFRDGLELALNAEDDVHVAGTAGDADGALRLTRSTAADVVLLDMSVEDSLGLAQVLAETVDVVALAIAETEASVIACAEAGAVGYVPRDASLADMARVVRSVADGEAVCSPRIAAGLLRRLGARAAGPSGPTAALTPREAQILAMIEEGMSNKEIARRLCIAVATVKNHVHNILEKLHVQRRSEAAAHLRRATGRGPVAQLPA